MFIFPIAVAALVLGTVASPTGRRASLGSLALQKVLQEAAPIFGDYTNDVTNTSEWMKAYPDDTLLVHMNIPGTHDPQTCKFPRLSNTVSDFVGNYSLATQQSLDHITDQLDGTTPLDPEYYRCQQKSFIDMLTAGIRVFDIRYAFDPTNSTLVYWHSEALLSETATVEDTLYGFYHWLDDHPSETLLLSFQYEGSTTLHGTNNADVQKQLYGLLTSAAAQTYFLQTADELGTLGEARGKITLLKRFDMDQVDASYSDLPGLHFSPALWTDNSPDITIVYNTAKNLTAYMEDFYETDGPVGSSAEYNIQLKYNATVAHLEKAATMYPDSLFWSFASSEYDTNIPAETPRIMALGNGTEYTPLGGVNQRLVPFFESMKGKRLGIVMFDFFDTPNDLIQTFLSI